MSQKHELSTQMVQVSYSGANRDTHPSVAHAQGAHNYANTMESSRRLEESVRSSLGQGEFPIVVGGDHS